MQRREKVFYAAIALLAVTILAGNTRSSTIEKSFTFENPSFVTTPAGSVVEVHGCLNVALPGEPMLPVYSACFLLPPGETVSSVSVETPESVIIKGSYSIAPMPVQTPPGRDSAAQMMRKSEIYGSISVYPAEPVAVTSEQTIAGLRLAYLTIHPCRVIPASGTVTFFPRIRVTIETAAAPAQAIHAPSRLRSRAFQRIAPSLQNPEMHRLYEGRNALSAESITPVDHKPYIIITSESLVEAFQPFADLKTQEGLRAEIVDLTWIGSNFTGIDLQEQIRAFIAYAYQNWQTEFVLLGGDDEIIPHRGLYVKVGTEIDADIPSDLYFAALDGNWNSDGDLYYGEPGEEDLLPEVTIGRLPADSAEEVQNFLAKLTLYCKSPVPSRCTNSLMLGELLWSTDGVDTWGGDYKDEILLGSSNYGFTTAGIPEHFVNTILYDRDLSFPWNLSHLLPALNDEAHIINHAGHANIHSVMRLSIYDIPLLTNNGPGDMPFIGYSHGCYACSFDNRDDLGAYHADDCIGEALVTGPAGAVAFVGNTRYGWDAPGSTAGVSQFFDRHFFDAIFGEGILEIGKALDDSRIDNIPYISYAAIRWVMYEMCLFGDPSMSIWTQPPERLTIVHDSVIVAGQEALTVSVSGVGGPIEGARVSLFNELLNTYRSAVTDSRGIAFVNTGELAAGEVLQLSCRAGNHYAYSETLSVAAITSSLPTIVSLILDDDPVGQSSGDGDGTAEAGEVIEIDITVENAGIATAIGTEVHLSCFDPYVSLIDSICPVGDLAAGASVLKDAAFTLGFDTNIPDGRIVELELTILSGEGRWKMPYSITVNAPNLMLESWIVTDSLYGNGNGCLEPWEHQTVHCSWKNTGGVDFMSPRLTLSFPGGSWAKVVVTRVEAPSIPAGGSMDFEGGLRFYIRDDTPPFSQISMLLTIEGANAGSITETVKLRTCGYELFDAVNSEEFWDHSTLIGLDGWHISTEQSHSGAESWKCGDNAAGSYANMMEAVLVSPPLCLYENSMLSFWHSMEAEAGTYYPYWALDAAVVEISADRGETWTIINPVGQYPARASSANTIFLPAYARCYSGSIAWKLEQFDLSAYHGPVMIRFHFASDEQFGFEGWYIDDIQITTDVSTGVEDGDTPPNRFINALRPAYPNPFNPTTVIPLEVARRARVDVVIYDVAGRHVRTLMEETLEHGRYQTTWDGRDSRGIPVSSGVYFCSVKIGIFTANQRLILIR